jgi:hypothetical protein
MVQTFAASAYCSEKPAVSQARMMICKWLIGKELAINIGGGLREQAYRLILGLEPTRISEGGVSYQDQGSSGNPNAIPYH